MTSVCVCLVRPWFSSYCKSIWSTKSKSKYSKSKNANKCQGSHEWPETYLIIYIDLHISVLWTRRTGEYELKWPLNKLFTSSLFSLIFGLCLWMGGVGGWVAGYASDKGMALWPAPSPPQQVFLGVKILPLHTLGKFYRMIKKWNLLLKKQFKGAVQIWSHAWGGGAG